MELVNLLRDLSLSEQHDDLADLFQKLELGEDLDLDEVTSKMKKCKIRWSARLKRLYNKQEVRCTVCGRAFQRGGKARHGSTRVHKKAVRAIKRKAKKERTKQS
jgi:hypothetical protein